MYMWTVIMPMLFQHGAIHGIMIICMVPIIITPGDGDFQ